MSDLNDQLRDMFDSAEFQPSDKVWAGVEQALVQKKKRGIFWMWQTYATAAIVLFIAAFSFILGKGSSEPVTSLNENANPQQLTELAQDSTDMNSSGADTLLSPKVQMPKLPLVAKNVSQNKESALVDPIRSSAATTSIRASANNLIVLRPDEQAESSSALGFNDARLKSYRESLALQILMFEGKMNMTMYEPDNANVLSLADVAENKAFRVSGGLGSGTFNSGESGLFSMAADEEAVVAFSDVRMDIDTGEDKVESVISVGAGVNFELSEKLSLDAGLRLSNFRIGSSSNAYSVEDGISLPISATAPFDPEEVLFIGEYATSNTFQSIFLQSALNYRVASFGKFDLNSRLGLGVDFFFNYKLQGDLNFLSIRSVNFSQNDISSTSLSIIPGLGLNYRINDQFGLSIDASYRRFITNSSVSVNGGTSIFGFGFSLNYLIKKD